MFFYISKILSFVISPAIWVFVLLLCALIFRRFRRKGLLFAFIVFYLFSNSFLFEEAGRLWEVPATPDSKLDHYDAAIVLGGMLNYDPELDRSQFMRGGDRLFQAIRLYHAGKVDRLIISGGSGSIEFQDYKEAVYVEQFLKQIRIQQDHVWIEPDSKNTRENAVNTRSLLAQNNLLSGKFILITSAYHMRRAKACFEKAGVHLQDIYSADRISSGSRRFTPDHLLLPQPRTFMLWDALIHEWVGYIVYLIKGYV